MAGAIYVRTSLIGIDEPAKACTAGDVLLELRLLVGQEVAGRTQLDHEVWTYGGKPSPLRLGQRIPARPLHPGDIRCSLGTIGQQESGRRVEPNAGSVAPDPRRELASQIEVAPSRLSARRWHDDKLSVAGAFDAELAIRRAEVEQVIVAERCCEPDP